MIPELRRAFNASYAPEKYQRFLELLDARCGTHVQFRNSETPCFFPRELLDEMAQAGREMADQLVGNREYLQAADQAIPSGFSVPHCSPHPMFLQADFGLTRTASGAIEPKLVEIQGFPSLYAYQPALAEVYREAYALDRGLQTILGGLDADSYRKLLCQAIVGGHDPENVVLLEVDPWQQKTLADFLLTEKICGIRTVAITDIRREGRRLAYDNGGRRVPIHRIYNRAIADEIIRKQVRADFRFDEDLEVEWAGHPNWFFRISKFSLPYLRHRTVPRTYFLDRLDSIPDDLDNWVMKPLYSFAGLGVTIGPSRAEIDAVSPGQRSQFILQERVRFEPLIETPHGPTQAEIRIMYIWTDKIRPVTTIVRMGRGKMMGVDQNRDLEWVGASAGFYPT